MSIPRRIVLWHRLLPSEESSSLGEEAPRWCRTVGARLQAAGGTVLGSLGSHVVVCFEPDEAEDALETALELLREARAGSPPLPASFGAEFGPLPERTLHALPVEVASQAASMASPSELWVGPALAARLNARYRLATPQDGTTPFRRLSALPPPASPPPPAPGARRRARTRSLLEAVRRGDAEAVAHEARVALAEGCDPAAARRILALARLLRGECQGALALLERDRPADPTARIRRAIARALALMASGAPRQAVPELLAALNEAALGGDANGRRAALATLALAYARIGRSTEAAELRRRAIEAA